jgi:hypothetical protein
MSRGKSVEPAPGDQAMSHGIAQAVRESAGRSSHDPARRRRPGRLVVCLGVLLGVTLLQFPAAVQAQGILQNLRDDVRNPPSEGGGCDTGSGSSDHSSSRSSDFDFDWRSPFQGGPEPLRFIGENFVDLLTLPIALPHEILGYEDASPLYFPRFPYEDGFGYFGSDRSPPPTRCWAGRVNIEYPDPFDHMDRVGGRLLLETTSRFGLDAQADYFRERLAGGRHDQLWAGDCNAVYRFAQSCVGEFRAGLGFNWMRDSIRDDFGFNFTYGADLFPCRPWVISTDIDLGTLGHAELFRFRTTVGVTVRNVEFYTGYEYTDIERMHLNSLIGGIRIWF